MRFHRVVSAVLFLSANWVLASTQGAEPAEALPRHCIAEVQATRIGETVPLYVPAAEPQCFGSFAEALYAATGGSVRLPSKALPANAIRALLAEEGPPPEVVPAPVPVPQYRWVIGTEYEHENYKGDSFTHYSTVGDCTTHNFEIARLSDVWNDRISSARASSGCTNSMHFEHLDFTGAQIDCFTECSTIGPAMNDRTTSIRWTGPSNDHGRKR